MVIGVFENMLAGLGPTMSLLLTLLFFTIVIIIYAVFIFYFYKFLAKKNIIDLKLNRYNRSEHPILEKFLASVFYIVEYIIILPIATFFWFAFLSVFLLLLAKSHDASTILLIATALAASVRVTSYINEQLSQDLAKMLPFTLLALAITETTFFNISLFLQRLNDVPALLSNLPYYILFIVVLELIMRFMDLFMGIFTFNSDEIEGNEEI